MKHGICKLCLEDKQLIHSHVFSEFLYEPTYDETHRYISVSSHPLHRDRLFEKGLREYLLCSSCDGQIGKYESYAAKILREAAECSTFINGAIEISDFNYPLFKLFGLSLIWRCHVSSLHMFGGVNLGTHAEKIRAMLLSEDPGTSSKYCFVLIKIVGAKSANTVIHAPTRTRFGDHNGYVFLAYGIEWVFIVSSHSHKLPHEYPFVGTRRQLVIPVMKQSEKEFLREVRRRFSKLGE
jgi:hypothetical protein